MTVGLGELMQVDAGELNIGFADVGPADGPAVLLLHNPDHVDIVIHNYRWRLDLADGASEYDDLERRLAERPSIAVPTITLEGDANGAPHPDAAACRSPFVGAYEHRVVTGGIGHNLPQEAPRAFADAVMDVDQAAAPSRSNGGGTHV